MADIIREFLVSLGFKVDEAGLKKFREGVGRATADAKQLGSAATVAATEVVAAISAIAEQYEQLYYQSLRTGSSVSTLKTFEYGSRAIGISAEQAAAGLEQLNLQMKLNPGREALANMLGVKTAGRETKEVYNDLIGVFARVSKQGPLGFAVASNYAAQFGISPADMLRRIQLRDQEAAAEERYSDKLRMSGLNVTELADKSHAYNQNLRDIGASMGLVWDQAANRWLPTMSSVLSWATSWADYSLRAGRNTEGLTSSLLALVTALGGLRVAASVLGALGIGGAVGTAGAVAGAGTSGLLAALGLGYALYPSAAGEGDAEEARRRGGAGARPATAAELNGGTGGGPTQDKVINYFVSRGWSREAAAGIAASLSRESRFNPAAAGDNGSAYGVAQWHPDRQANFKAWAGKDIRGSSLEEQLAFIHHELTQGGEQNAGRALRGATSAAGAGAIVSSMYERPGNAQGEEFARSALAKRMFDSSLTPASSSGGGVSITQNNNINVSSSDPVRAAEMTGREVRSANQDLVRNAGVNVR